jgi:acyl-CoA reductase-like NAD-dependent aldehyde dehydrogenase
MVIIQSDDEDEALATPNDSPYGLEAGLSSANPAQGRDLSIMG